MWLLFYCDSHHAYKNDNYIIKKELLLKNSNYNHDINCYTVHNYSNYNKKVKLNKIRSPYVFEKYRVDLCDNDCKV